MLYLNPDFRGNEPINQIQNELQFTRTQKSLMRRELSSEFECVCVCVHVYVVYEDTNLYNDMGMT